MRSLRARFCKAFLCVYAAAIAVAGAACRSNEGDAGAQCVDCGVRDEARDLTVVVESRYAAITEAPVVNLVWNPADKRPQESRSGTCSSDGVRALCTVPGVGPGEFAFDVIAEGFQTGHRQVDITNPIHWASLPPVVWISMYPQPDPTCIAEFGSEDPLPRGAPGNCHAEADLSTPAPVDQACPSLTLERPEPRTVVIREQYDAFCADPVSNHAGAFTAAQHRDAMVALVGIPPAFWGGDGTGLVHNPAIDYATGVAFPTNSGFLYVDLGWSADYPNEVYAVSSTGDVISTVELDWKQGLGREPSAVAQDDDGSVVVVSGGSGCAEYVSGLHAMRVDATGEPRGGDWPVVSLVHEFDAARNEPVAVGFPVAVAAVAATDAAGRMLVIWGGDATCGPGTLAGRWFEAEGRPLSPVFVAAVLDHFADPWRLQRLADGSLALQMSDGEWLRRFAEGTPAGGPPPRWLVERPRWDVRLIREGTAHAAIPPDASCAPRVEILSADGERCDAREYPPPAGAPATGCEPWFMYPVGSLSVGPDGTISRIADVRWCPSPAGCIECVYEWWLQDLAAP